MTHFLLTVLSQTPIWVWAILVALLALGLRQSRDHVVGLPRLLIQPLALGGLSLFASVSAFGLQAGVLAAWLAGLAAGAALNQPLRLPRQARALAGGGYAIGGSWAPLALLMTIFWLRYVVAASLAVVPALAALPAFVGLAGALYGASAGLLGARAWRVLRLRQPWARAAAPA